MQVVRLLSDDPSAESLRRRPLAERIARECPSTFATEIAISGSTAIGVADAYSDLERGTSTNWGHRHSGTRSGRLCGGDACGQNVTMSVTISFYGCPVVELRRYTLHRGRLPDLLAVFEHHLIEPQEDSGMVVGGTFADEEDPDSFTWLRGFADHDARVRALEAFYNGPVWASHRDAANATMVDSDDVLLLRPTEPPHPPAAAVPRGERDAVPRPERVLVGTYGLADDADAVEAWFAAAGNAALEEALATRVAAWRTDPTPNGFPRLPVRPERALAWLAVFVDADARDAAVARLTASDVGRELGRRTVWQRTFRLQPTARSAHPRPRPPVSASVARMP
jgi:hypothetical protein